MANIDLYQLVSGAENPVSFVAAGYPAGKGACHRAASQVFFNLIFILPLSVHLQEGYSSFSFNPLLVLILQILRKSILYHGFHPLNSQEEHPPAGGSDGPKNNPGRFPTSPLCQQEQHTQDPGIDMWILT